MQPPSTLFDGRLEVTPALLPVLLVQPSTLEVVGWWAAVKVVDAVVGLGVFLLAKLALLLLLFNVRLPRMGAGAGAAVFGGMFDEVTRRFSSSLLSALPLFITPLVDDAGFRGGGGGGGCFGRGSRCWGRCVPDVVDRPGDKGVHDNVDDEDDDVGMVVIGDPW